MCVAQTATLCFDELWGESWSDGRGSPRPPRLDLAIVEFNWSSSPKQMSALIESLHARNIPVVGILYYHPVDLLHLRKLGAKKIFNADPRPAKHRDPEHDPTYAFARIFEHHEVSFVNTSLLNERYGWRAMLNTTRKLWSAAHLSPLGHSGIAGQISALVSSTSGCARAFHLPARPVLGGGSDYFCRIGASLTGLVHSGRSQGWRLHMPLDGRTPGYVASSSDARLVLTVPTPAGGRFLSMGYEKSWRNEAAANVTCGGSCVCAAVAVNAHTRKQYSYLQRTESVWLLPNSGAAEAVCEVIVQATSLVEGRLMVQAITVSAPLPGNRTVSAMARLAR